MLIVFIIIGFLHSHNFSNAAPLTGIKTIGGSSPDYATLAAAITDLNANGVGAGGVTFNIRNGTYAGGTAISSITAVGTSGNPIVFQSESGDSTLVIISSATTSNVVTVSGGAYITFRKLTIDYTSNGSYSALKLTLNADNITVTNCILDGTSATTTGYANSVIYAAETIAGNNCDNFHLFNSVVRSGSYGVYFSMTSSSQSTGLVIQGNKFSENAAGGIRTVNHAYINITCNSIYRSISVNSSYGMYIDNCDSVSQITKNYIYTTGTGTMGWGIYLTGSSASKTGNSNLSNNSIQVQNAANPSYGIDQNTTSLFWNIYNNTIYISAGTSATTYCYRTYASNDSTKLKNNIFINAANNVGASADQTVYFANAGAIKKQSNNCYYTVNTGNPFRAYKTPTNYTVFSTYATAAGETNSVNIDPTMVFTAGVGWKATNAALTGAGVYIVSVPTDIDGKTRVSPNTTIGAHENGVIIDPTIIVSTLSLSPFTAIVPTPSTVQTYTVEGVGLAVNLVVTAPANFEIRQQGIGSFGSSVSFVPVGGTVTSKTIEVRYNPTVAGSHNGIITHISAGATQKDVSLTGSSTHYMGGTYKIGVGASNDFHSLAEAVDSLNLAIVTSDIIFELQTDYNGANETCPIIINPVTSNKAVRNITVRPASNVVSMLMTSGDPGLSNPFITFNGIDYFTLDGRAGGTGSTILWTIRNSRTSSVGPAIKLTNGANNNILQYIRVESQNTSSTSGTIYISGYPSWTAGNNNITIRNCDITKYNSGSATHVNAIYAFGQTANPNSYISILNNNIHSFTPGLNYEATGVTVTGTDINTNYGDNWVITGNSFFLDCAEQELHRYTVINFIPGLGSTGNVISGNYIGGSAPQCGGTAWTSAVGGAGNTIQTFEGIYVWAGTTDITGNRISNINLTATGGTSFGAIHLANCDDDFTISDNFIGGEECDGIVNAGQWKTVGIWCDNSCGNLTLTNNVIANVSATNMVNDAATVTGIYSDCGANTITNNTVFNLTSACANTTSNLYIAHDGSAVGIATNSIYNARTQNVSNNTIYNINNSLTTPNATKVYGMYINIAAPGTTHIYNANKIYGISAPNGNTSAIIIGIGIPGPSWASAVTSLFSNNMIDLGYRTDGTVISSSAEITGILDNSPGYTSGANTVYMNFYFNTVNVSGSGIVSGTVNTYAFRRDNTNSSPKNTEDLQNNIFVNRRSNSSGTGKHYSIYLDNTSTVSSNYNDLWGNGTGYQSGNAGSINYATNAAWNTGTSLDANSISGDPLFVKTSVVPDLHVQSGSPVIGAGTNVGVSVDFDNGSRTNPYDIGADEYSSGYTLLNLGISGCGGEEPLPVQLLSFTAVADKDHVDLKWTTASETNNDYFTVERSRTPEDFEKLLVTDGAGNSNTVLTYHATDEDPYPGLSYYRLKQTDFDGAFSYSEIRPVLFGIASGDGIINTYVDENDLLNIIFNSANDDKINISIYDMKGMLVRTRTDACSKGANELKIDVSQAAGIYFLWIMKGEEVFIKKFSVPLK